MRFGVEFRIINDEQVLTVEEEKHLLNCTLWGADIESVDRAIKEGERRLILHCRGSLVSFIRTCFAIRRRHHIRVNFS